MASIALSMRQRASLFGFHRPVRVGQSVLIAPVTSGRRTRITTVMSSGAGLKPLIALDFDGVICDSCGESSLSAMKAAAIIWPEPFATAKVELRQKELLDKMRAVRPVVETGYENVVQIRCLYEGAKVDDILARWEEMLQQRMEEWGLKRAEMVDLFGRVRDEWIAKDLQGWLDANNIYAGVAQPLQAAVAGAANTYVVTTKQAHFTELLLHNTAKVPIDAQHIFSTTVAGIPKSEVLHKLQARHRDASAYIFVEDKLGTLEKVAKVPELADWRLYLVDWGYNTPAERERAANHPRIQVIGKDQFTKLVGGGKE